MPGIPRGQDLSVILLPNGLEPFGSASLAPILCLQGRRAHDLRTSKSLESEPVLLGGKPASIGIPAVVRQVLEVSGRALLDLLLAGRAEYHRTPAAQWNGGGALLALYTTLFSSHSSFFP